ncbi:MAG: geranylgeranylglycerol-phosphate geranylgeranyltransferase [Cytophagales bacterium]|jgi:4-hydroxybenzoate polyprenyltransferase|nr:geranylgeranylglycerol-phosphate geranylgeranyltransferase [Cytophagales bacterium]MCA6386283.1 geranylgeranylglycerol-phosphate geranylgeranyltransferase [Cytophagales bacterium]MCA6391480.1 geranylgeranylglycerol-phosphate geranylgeranyltransferase [Cytophagales bacterium]MCA6394674.1 geranylgeranylglycerol-phosphate geranylgeranyltransferase [Cytophagales bacterium]MCA6399148.1 geranylgeranylglycerol-phosphate geranylgeranyltransferase [Cytophagales bacterium]
MQLILDLFRLTRFWNLAIIAFAQYFTAYFLFHQGLLVFADFWLFLIVASTVMIAAAGYIINDYYDIKIDLINKPDRVVIGKTITRRYAIFFHTVISVAGVGKGLLINWKVGAVNFVSVFLLWLYSNNLKRLPLIGNLVVALLTGLSIFLLSFLYEQYLPLVITYSLFAFFMTLIREIVKDMEDMKGDTTFGCRTLPIVWGIRKTKSFLYGTILAFSFLVLWLDYHQLKLSWIYFIPLLFVPMSILFYRLLKADTKKEFFQLSQLCKIIMLLGICSMIFV